MDRVVSKWRALLAFIAIAAAFAASLLMLRQAIGADSPWLGLVLMFCFLGLAKIAEPLFMLRMPRRLHALRSWERTGGIDRALGVRAFGRLLRGTPLHYLNPSLYLSGQASNLQRVVALVEAAEASHFWAALLLLPFIGLAFAAGQYFAGTVFVLIQVFFNIYPILHLRLVRQRLSRYALAASRNRKLPGVTVQGPVEALEDLRADTRGAR